MTRVVEDCRARKSADVVCVVPAEIQRGYRIPITVHPRFRLLIK